MSTLNQLTEEIEKFRTERDWHQFHSPKNLAGAISIEAAELLEIFQWCTTEESRKILKDKESEVKSEIADIATYLLYLCKEGGFDLAELIKEKLEISRAKYPVEKSKGKSTKYTELQ